MTVAVNTDSGAIDAEITPARLELSTVSGNLRVRGYTGWDELKKGTDPRFGSALDAMSRNLRMAKDPLDAQVVHAHTWYADMAAYYARMLWQVPMVVSIHSLEPLRPWKAEQLGSAYSMSSWMERTAIESADAIIAVSKGTRQDVLDHFDVDESRIHVIHNGIDLQQYVKATETNALQAYGVDPARPYVLFVGRIARQKGIIHLVEAIPQIDPDLQVVLLAGQPDTAEIADEMNQKVTAAARGKKCGRSRRRSQGRSKTTATGSPGSGQTPARKPANWSRSSAAFGMTNPNRPPWRRYS
jgi:alpha-maltose-1-phosphate synthase